MKYRIGKITNMVVHYIGNKYHEEGVNFSRNETPFQDIESELITTLQRSFVAEDIYHFHYEPEMELNPVYRIIKAMFEKSQDFIEQTSYLARALYEQSYSPKIKGGELNVIYLNDCEYDQQQADAIAILKTEIKQPLIQYYFDENGIKVRKTEGVLLSRIDKGCLIFNIEADSGYKVVLIDNKNNREAALYWKDSFLHVKAEDSSFHQTKELLSGIKRFVDQNIINDKVEKAQVLSRSKEILCNAETINLNDFAKDAFQDQALADSFAKDYMHNLDIDNTHNNIQINNKMAKPKSALPSVIIHLDSNFDIKIFGGEDMIIKGYDKDAQLNYYKLYYKKEK